MVPLFVFPRNIQLNNETSHYVTNQNQFDSPLNKFLHLHIVEFRVLENFLLFAWKNFRVYVKKYFTILRFSQKTQKRESFFSRKFLLLTLFYMTSYDNLNNFWKGAVFYLKLCTVLVHLRKIQKHPSLFWWRHQTNILRILDEMGAEN